MFTSLPSGATWGNGSWTGDASEPQSQQFACLVHPPRAKGIVHLAPMILHKADPTAFLILEVKETKAQTGKVTCSISPCEARIEPDWNPGSKAPRLLTINHRGGKPRLERKGSINT